MGSDRSHPTRVLRRRAARPSSESSASGAQLLALQLSQVVMVERRGSARRRGRVTVLPPLDPIRRPLGTRELSEARPAAATVSSTGSGELGPATSHGAWDLTCDLPSPIAVGAEPRYRLGLPGVERSSPARRATYRWTVRDRADGHPIWRIVTVDPELRIAAAAPGRYIVDVVVLANGTSTGVCLSLDHVVELEPEVLTIGLEGANVAVAQAMRELVNDLRPYVIEAAAATGPNGITARCLAAVLFIEILSRPKAAREAELDDPGSHDRPLGVGQIRPMTAAMVMGAAPWIDQDRSDRRPARELIKAGYDALSPETKRSILTRLRWPKSNITLTAKLLATLKNRPNRYPELTRAQLATDPGAVGIIATEYVSGATQTPAADARPSGYGSWVWHQMQESLMQRFFPND
jgi:hypothetical protein